MTFDGRTGMSLEWNDLVLVEKVSMNGEDLANYFYRTDGTKIPTPDGPTEGRKIVSRNTTRSRKSTLNSPSAPQRPTYFGNAVKIM